MRSEESTLRPGQVVAAVCVAMAVVAVIGGMTVNPSWSLGSLMFLFIAALCMI